ncbi:MAG: CoA pyrophosphatase, partial [Proteobacteria bacterium]|nr:CoA pyrophosphatase [Pseudomonadota bacterium]
LKQPSGQVSFPGGGFESSDGNIRNTALSETYEAVGIDEKDIEILGYLDNIQSISGFQVTPFVGEIKQGFSCQADSNEVSDVFGVPFEFFLDDNNRHKQQIKTNKGMRHYYLYKYNGYTIWGMTAQIIVQLVKRLKKQ